MLATLDSTLRPIRFAHFPDLPDPLGEVATIVPESHIAVLGDTIASVTNPAWPLPASGKLPSAAGVTFWKHSGRRLQYIGAAPVPWPVGADRADSEDAEALFITGDRVAIHRETEPTIYDARSGAVVGHLHSPTLGDTVTRGTHTAARWVPLTSGHLTPHLVALLTTHRDKFVLTINDNKFNWLQSLELTPYLKNARSICLSKNLQLTALLPFEGTYVLRRYTFGPAGLPASSTAQSAECR